MISICICSCAHCVNKIMCCVFVPETQSVRSDLGWHYSNAAVVSELSWACKAKAPFVSELLAAFPTECTLTVGDLVHGTYFTSCPACVDSGGWGQRREGKEMQHSFEELGFLDGNNHMWKKNKAENSCSDTVEGCNSSTVWLFYAHIRIYKVELDCCKWRLPLAVKGWFNLEDV